MALSAELAATRARDVALLVLDVDGVLTDGGLYVDAHGGIAKRFHAHDGLGIKAAQMVGLQVAVISGLDSPAVAARIKELGIGEYHPGHHHKVPILTGILARLGLSPGQAAYLGDDWVDAGPMGLVGLPMAVADAQPEITDLALWVASRPGGHGAVREAIRFLLQASGRLDAAYAWFLSKR
uniref:3-deoxy-D-manno-octulosonate 8-phosphate phosphatase, YrbI family n=1 Tax=Desulfovibrio sp. U5L TaxID=596152 RepID=I2Q1T7_9BACT